MVIAIGGKNDIACHCLHFLLNFDIPRDNIIVVPNPSDTGIDGWQRSLLRLARLEKLNIYPIEELYDIENLIFFSLEYEKIIKVEKFKSQSIFNIHFSLLPEYKGMFTSCLPLLDGKKYSGVTLHKIERGIDTGDIIDQVKIEIPTNTTAFELYNIYTDYGKTIFIQNLKKILNEDYPIKPQSPIESTYFSKNKIDFSAVKIDFNATANQIHNYIRAFTFRPFQLVKINQTAISHSIISNTKSNLKPGILIGQDEFCLTYSSIDFDIKIYTDQLALILRAAEMNDLPLVKTYYRLGYRLDEKNEKGWNALIVAAYNNSFEVLQFLVEIGCDIETQNYNGTSVMMYAMTSASTSNDLRLFNYLVDKGSNLEHSDYKGISLKEYAQKLNNSEVLGIINSVYR